MCAGKGGGEVAAEAALWKALAGSEAAWRLPLLVTRGHLALLHTRTSLFPATPPSLGASGCGEQRAVQRLPGPRGPGKVKVSAAAPTLALGGWEEGRGRAGKGVLPFAAGAGSRLLCSIVT